MMQKERNDNIGSLRVSEDVISTVARLALNDVEGIDEIIPVNTNTAKKIKNKKDIKFFKIPNFIKTKGNSEKKNLIAIKPLEDVVEITMSIIAKQGYNVRTISENVQQTVKASIQNMAGITVSRVNVVVAGISFNK